MALSAALVGARGTAGANTATTTGGTTQSTGSTFAALVSYDATAGTINTAGDNKGNTYTALGTAQSDGNGGLLRWYVCENGTGGASHTFTFATASNHYGTVHLFEVRSDVGGKIAAVDLQVQGTDAAQPWDSLATGTLGSAADYVLGAVAANAGGTGDYASSNTTILSQEPDVSSYWTSGVGGSLRSATTSFAPAFTNAGRGGGTGAGLSHVAFIEEDAPGGGGAMSGTSTVAFSTAGILRGAGALAGAAAVAFTLSGAMAAPGAMAGSASVAFSTSGALVGAGRLSGTSTVAFSASATAASVLPAIGGHGFDYDFIAAGGSSISTSTFTTAPTSFVLASVGRGTLSDHASNSVSDNQGNGTYNQIGTAHAYTDWPSSGTALYGKLIAAGGAGHAVTAAKPDPSDEVTVLAVEGRNVNAIIDQQWNEDLTSPNTSASVTVTGPALLVSFWWGDDSNGELLPAVGSPWTLLDNTSSLASNHVQGASAYREVTTAGTYSVEWTPSTSQGAQIWIVALQNVSAAAGSSSASFSASATLRASGVLSGAASPAFSTSGTLRGTASAAGAASGAFSTAGILRGAGAASASSAVAFSTAGILRGAGVLAGSTSVAFTAAGTTTQPGSMSGASGLTFSASGVLVGAGALSGSLSMSFTASLVPPAAAEDTRVTVPYLIGYTQEPAQDVIASIYCNAVLSGSGGTVTAQSEPAFSLVERGTSITITMGGAIQKVKKNQRGLPRYS